jgi:hypothetical protein
MVEKTNPIVFQFMKRAHCQPRPRNEGAHFKWCACNLTTKWPKGGCFKFR